MYVNNETLEGDYSPRILYIYVCECLATNNIFVARMKHAL